MKKLAQDRTASIKTRKKLLATNLDLDEKFKEDSNQPSNEQETHFPDELNPNSSSDNEDVERKVQSGPSVHNKPEEETRIRSMVVILEYLRASLLKLHYSNENGPATITSLPTVKGDNFCLNLGLQEGTCEFKKARDSFLDRFTAVNYNLIKLIEKSTVCLQDFQKNPQLPSLQQFLGMRLWRNIENSNNYLKNHLGKFMDESKTKTSLPDSPQETSFYNWYMARMTLEFENDLREICPNPINEDDLAGDTSQMEMLFDCINLALKSFDIEEADRLKRLKP